MIASPTCETPWLCSVLAALISPMMSVTLRMDATTSTMVAPALSTSDVPCSTRCTLALISSLISLAALALRCARLRTSVATTANPRPCSPARAASTAAFKARMFVWKAMPSITPMMSAIFLLLSLMPFMVSTTSDTTSPPCTATVEALMASWLARLALSAFCLTVELSSSIDAAVCCKALACSSVRLDRSVLPAAICELADATPCALPRTPETTVARLSRMEARPAIRWAISSRPCTSIFGVRSPWATVPAMATASFNAREIWRIIAPPTSAASRTASTMDTVVSARMVP